MKRVSSIVMGLALVAVVHVSARQQTAQPPAVQQQTAPTPAAQEPQAPKARIIQRVLVKVNGEIFTQTELEQKQIQAVREKRPNINTSKDLQSDSALVPLLQQLTPDILVDAVDELLLLQFGKEQGYHMSDENFTKFVDGFKKDNKINDADLKAALADQGMTMDAWRQQVEQQFIIDQVNKNDIMTKASVTEEELRQYYAAHPDEFKTSATVTLREILVAVPTAMVGGKPMMNAGADEAAKTKIEGIRERILKGEDFAKVTAEVSDSDTKTAGGLMSPFKLDELSPEFRKILDPMKVGDVTEPVRTPRGWQLLKLDTRTQPVLRPFDQVQEDLRAKVVGARLDAEQGKFLVKIRTTALIEWKDDRLKTMYEQRLAERSAQGK